MVEASGNEHLSRIYPLKKSDRDAIITAAAERALMFQERERKKGEEKGGGWGSYDSYLDNPFDDGSLETDFGCLLPEGESSLSSYIERLLRRKRGAAIGIEFGGPGSNLFGDFSQGFFHQTAGVTLADLRTDSVKARDDERRHIVIEGDMFSSEKQQEVAKWLSGKKADVIFERMGLGLYAVPKELRFLSVIAGNWYQMLAEGGIMFVQIPAILEPAMGVWKDFVEYEYSDQIQIQVELQHGGYSMRGGSMRLNKLEGAPVNLPLLPPKVVRELYRVFPLI